MGFPVILDLNPANIIKHLARCHLLA